VVPTGDPGPTLAADAPLSALGAFLKTLQREKIRFQVIGMTAAILQGAPGGTIDTDLWIDLPEREYMRVNNLAHQLGGKLLAPTAVEIEDGVLLNFCYRIDGVASFNTEYRRAKWIEWEGVRVKVLPLASVIRSKEAAGREKDLAVLPLLRATASCSAVRRKNDKLR
jgi:predicted nucleotidyltransferase